MPTALVIGARNLGLDVIERLLADGWTVAGALREVAERHGRVDLAVNAASPYGGGRSGPFGGGPLAEATPSGVEDWSVMPVRGAFAFLSACARFLTDQGGPATVVQVTGGSARRGMPGRGLWAAGAFGVRALTQAAAAELRESGIHVALLIVDARIDRSGSDDAGSADPASLAGAVAYLAAQSPRAMTHELQVTPALDQWVP